MGHLLIWMISGLNNPRWLSNIINNYTRQTYKEKKLIIVENGGGIDSTKSIKLPYGTIVLKSESGPAQAINSGISFLRSHTNVDWFCKCDSDDYYGPEYLNQIYKATELCGDYIGRRSLYIKTTDNNLWYINSNEDNYIFHGPTLAAKVDSAFDFPLVQDWGEDDLWCRNMYKAGRKPITLPAEGFCYQRWSDYKHTWPCTDLEIRTSWKSPILSLGEFDLDIINGKKTQPKGIVLETPTVDYTNFMPLRLLRERATKYVGF